MLDRRMLSFLTSDDPDGTLVGHLAEAVAAPPTKGAARWRPGQPLRLLLAGYLGAGDVGADIRATETVRQLRYLLGADVTFDAIAHAPAVRAGGLPGVRAVPLEGYPPDAIRAAVDATHGVIACGASLFRSPFSNSLSASTAAALGMAARDGKLSVAYGGATGPVDPILAEMVRDTAADTLVLAASRTSLIEAERMGLRASPGADPAWTFTAAPREDAEARLRALGWNGRSPVLAVCPANPFWWPLAAAPEKAAEMRTNGAHADVHYAQLFFHADSVARRAAYRTYIEAMGQAVAAMGMFAVYIAIGPTDAPACRDLAKMMPAPVVSGADLPLGATAALLRTADMVFGSRYDALVAAIPGLKPSIGIAADERLRTLLDPSRILAADSRRLAEELILLPPRLDPDAIAAASQAVAAEGLRGIGRMGELLVAEVRRVLPDYTLHDLAPGWRGHLPPLSPELEALLS